MIPHFRCLFSVKFGAVFLVFIVRKKMVEFGIYFLAACWSSVFLGAMTGVYCTF